MAKTFSRSAVIQTNYPNAPHDELARFVKKNGSDKYYKSFSSWDELVSPLFGIFSCCDLKGMHALGGKLNY
ncbi:MAG: DUF4372 domain-containing protein [Prevotellaceae bacterium]|jgi:hypothetical protein|nr:DUF4372 domain-containing protein [Prevotellaceae bacterium]